MKAKRLVKVRVYYRNPLGAKSGAMLMTESQITWNRQNKGGSSPYTKIVRVGKK